MLISLFMHKPAQFLVHAPPLNVVGTYGHLLIVAFKKQSRPRCLKHLLLKYDLGTLYLEAIIFGVLKIAAVLLIRIII